MSDNRLTGVRWQYMAPDGDDGDHVHPVHAIKRRVVTDWQDWQFPDDADPDTCDDLPPRPDDFAGDPRWSHVVIGGPWPGRIGHRCRLVEGPADEYPWHGRDESEVVILISNDPVAQVPGDVWTCVMDFDDIAVFS